jgi:hypothetical protein
VWRFFCFKLSRSPLFEIARVLVRLDHVAHSILKKFFHCCSLCVRHLRSPSHTPGPGISLQPCNPSTLLPDHLAAVIRCVRADQWREPLATGPPEFSGSAQQGFFVRVFLTTERPIFCADEAGTALILARDTVGSCRRRNESDRAPQIGSRPECKLWSLRRRTDGLSSFAAWPKKR